MDQIEQLLEIVRSSTSSSTIYLASITLSKIICRKKIVLSNEQISDMYDSLFTILYQYGIDIGDESKKSICITISKCTKYYYKELDVESVLMVWAKKFYLKSTQHTIIMFQLIIDILYEMSQVQDAHLSVMARKQVQRSVQKFTDNLLTQFLDKPLQLIKEEEASLFENKELIYCTLELIYQCLTYNFCDTQQQIFDSFQMDKSPLLLPIGKLSQFSAEVFENFKDHQFIRILFIIVKECLKAYDNWRDCICLSLDIINSLCRINLKFFKNEHSLIEHIYFIVNELITVISEQLLLLLSDTTIMKHFASIIPRTVVKVKFDFQLQQSNFQSWIKIVRDFTIDTIQYPIFDTDVLNSLYEFWSNFTYYIRQDLMGTDDVDSYLIDIIVQSIYNKYQMVDKYVDQQAYQSDNVSLSEEAQITCAQLTKKIEKMCIEKQIEHYGKSNNPIYF